MKREDGFTLIEMLLASTLLLVTAASAFGLITASLRNLDDNQRREAAHDFVQSGMGVIRNTPYSALSANGLTQQLLPLWQERASRVGAQASFSISVQSEEAGLSLVRCQVRGNRRGHEVTLSESLIRVSNRGINP